MNKLTSVNPTEVNNLEFSVNTSAIKFKIACKDGYTTFDECNRGEDQPRVKLEASQPVNEFTIVQLVRAMDPNFNYVSDHVIVDAYLKESENTTLPRFIKLRAEKKKQLKIQTTIYAERISNHRLDTDTLRRIASTLFAEQSPELTEYLENKLVFFNALDTHPDRDDIVVYRPVPTSLEKIKANEKARKKLWTIANEAQLLATIKFFSREVPENMLDAPDFFTTITVKPKTEVIHLTRLDLLLIAVIYRLHVTIGTFRDVRL